MHNKGSGCLGILSKSNDTLNILSSQFPDFTVQILWNFIFSSYCLICGDIVKKNILAHI